MEKSYSENAPTLTARFGPKSKTPPLDLTYMKFWVISSKNTLKDLKFHAGKRFYGFWKLATFWGLTPHVAPGVGVEGPTLAQF